MQHNHFGPIRRPPRLLGGIPKTESGTPHRRKVPSYTISGQTTDPSEKIRRGVDDNGGERGRGGERRERERERQPCAVSYKKGPKKITELVNTSKHQKKEMPAWSYRLILYLNWGGG